MTKFRALAVGSLASILSLGIPLIAIAADEIFHDEEFLEFLGSWDGEDDEWLDLLDLAEMRVNEESDTDAGDVSEARKDED
jgi:hypothetical protein